MYRVSIDKNELKGFIKSKIRHAYVEKYIDMPFIDDHKIAILSEIYHHVDIPFKNKRQSALTVMLVQIALDTHELVPANGLEEMTEKEKQLSVLAGDFYSGLYYLFLSEIEQIDFVNLLAGAIKQINELKMGLFYGEFSSFHDFVQKITEIESLLFTTVASYLGCSQNTIQYIKETLLLNRLDREIYAIKQGRDSYFSHYVENNQLKQDPIDLIESEIKQHQHVLDSLQLPYFHFQPTSRKKEVELSYNISVAKEG